MRGSDPHPLEATFCAARDQEYQGCALGVDTACEHGREWCTLSSLARSPAALQKALDAVGTDVGTARRDVQASLFLEAYAWSLTLPLIAARISARRVALPTLEDVLIEREAGLPHEIVLRPESFAALAADPATRHPGATIVDDLDAALRQALVSHFEPLVALLGAHSGRSTRALWRSVADRCATASVYAGAGHGDVDAGVSVAARLLDGEAPFGVYPNFRPAAGSGAPEAPTHLRHGCCLWWRTAAAGGPCLTCPLTRAEAGPKPA